MVIEIKTLLEAPTPHHHLTCSKTFPLIQQDWKEQHWGPCIPGGSVITFNDLQVLPGRITGVHIGEQVLVEGKARFGSLSTTKWIQVITRKQQTSLDHRPGWQMYAFIPCSRQLQTVAHHYNTLLYSGCPVWLIVPLEKNTLLSFVNTETTL